MREVSGAPDMFMKNITIMMRGGSATEIRERMRICTYNFAEVHRLLTQHTAARCEPAQECGGHLVQGEEVEGEEEEEGVEEELLSRLNHNEDAHLEREGEEGCEKKKRGVSDIFVVGGDF